MGGVRSSYREWPHATSFIGDEALLAEKADAAPGSETGVYMTLLELLEWMATRGISFSGAIEMLQSLSINVTGAAGGVDINVDSGQIGDVMFQSAGLNVFAVRKTNTNTFQIKAYDPSTGALARNALTIDTAGQWVIIAPTGVKLTTGTFFGDAMHNNSILPTGTTNQPVGQSGTWTPTATLSTNAAACSPYGSQWMRAGNCVSFSGKVDITPTAAGVCEVRLSLPLGSTFAAEQNAGGSFSASSANLSGRILALHTTPFNLLRFVFVAPDTSNRGYSYSGMYLVL